MKAAGLIWCTITHGMAVETPAARPFFRKPDGSFWLICSGLRRDEMERLYFDSLPLLPKLIANSEGRHLTNHYYEGLLDSRSAVRTYDIRYL